MVVIIIDEKKEQPNELQEQVETPPPYSARQPTISDGNVRPNGAPRSTQPHPLASPVSIASPSRAAPPRPFWPSRPPPPHIRPRNHTHINVQSERLHGQFVIDPYLPVDETGLGAEGSYDNRRNLKIVGQSADVNIDVWILGGGEGRPPAKASIEVTVDNGPITLRIHTPSSAPPLHLLLSTRNAPLNFFLPRNLTGPVTTRTPNGWVSLSHDLAADVTTFSESGRRVRVRKGWVGDVTGLSSFVDEATWQGSFVDLTCENGRLKISYVDEENEDRSAGGRFNARRKESLGGDGSTSESGTARGARRMGST